MLDLVAETEAVRKLSIRLDSMDDSIRRNKEDRRAAETKEADAKEAQVILQTLAQAVQQKAHAQISEVVSRCLSAVFDTPYEFAIEFKRARGRTEASLRFKRGNLNVDPLTSSGGGVVDVAAFALRAACLVLHRPRLSKVLVLDEPFRFVSVQYQEAVRQMLDTIAQDMKVQIIMVTHMDTLARGKVIEL